jgi:phosphomannomutase
MAATQKVQDVLVAAERGVEGYLSEALAAARIDRQLYDLALGNVIPNLKQWLSDPEIDRISPRLKDGVARAIGEERWEQVVNAYRQSVRFGTGGIRGMMAFDRESIVRMKEEGIGIPILKGPNTINEIVLLKTSVGVAQFGKQQPKPFEKVVVGYDSRVRGQDLARTVAELFLAYGYTVFFFDEPCPYPEVTFAIPAAAVKADVGIFVSASHNDYRYNGYKLSCGNGSQFDPEQRDEMYEKYIVGAQTKDIKLLAFAEAEPGKLVFLGGADPLPECDYAGHQRHLINLHQQHCDHVQSFLMMDDLAASQQTTPLHIGYCAYHGAGTKAVPRLLKEVGFVDIKPIHVRGLNEPNGLFPCFCSDPGKEEQPDPGDPNAAEIAVSAFKEEYGEATFKEIDILIGTDPDADRCGVTVKVPPEQQALYDGNDYTLLPADDLWALLMWYRLQKEQEKYGAVRDADKKFIVQSHTTSDSIVRVARKFGLGVIKTWVGFAALAAAVRDAWDGKPYQPLVEGRTTPTDALCHPIVCQYQDMNQSRSINVAAMEQSNGFSILGGPPPDASSLGTDGHVRDKDGTFAALLTAEIAAWAKQQGTTLLELLDRQIYLDPDVGLFVNHYEPDPLIGEYPGIEGDQKKLAILRRALGYFQLALAGSLEIAGMPVKSATIYRTGKYDRIYPATFDFQFPDEGVRFFFDDVKLSHLTVRPSGTGNSLRFHVQLYAPVTEATLIEQKGLLRRKAVEVADDIRRLLQAPRSR